MRGGVITSEVRRSPSPDLLGSYLPSQTWLASPQFRSRSIAGPSPEYPGSSAGRASLTFVDSCAPLHLKPVAAAQYRHRTRLGSKWAAAVAGRT